MADVNELRAPLLAASPLPNVDRRYTFYCDETNNIRRLHLAGGMLNIEQPECFVLGGIVHRGPERPIDLHSLHEAMRFQATAKEIKLRHLGSGAFLNLLDAERTTIFLQWLTDEGFLVHFQATDVLYWSIVDIIDSIIVETEGTPIAPFHRELKNGLYDLLREDVAGTAALLARYRYPAVGERRRAFVCDLLVLLEAHEERFDHFTYYMLKGLLQMGRDLERLPFLESEAPDVLIDGFGHFFLNRFCLFKESSHILDEEPLIEEFLARNPLTDRGLPFQNYRFANSETEPGVQLSDVVAGLLGKMFSYTKQTLPEDIQDDVSRLSERQRRNLQAFATLLDRSTDECPAFAHYVISDQDNMRCALLFQPGLM